ncbi:C-X-C chemokine receptor type 5 isoform X2 [Hemicordylus capensis]|uniref:C-X-C chemokine receptor type 5 isoform X2 n=1 Tax=Hemicordylus capensis TaxID=884348 RepID=UPI002303FAC7|nr:C-X-C chemokine receptor type 5 isoform X2 [Hemicordylus capensis]
MDDMSIRIPSPVLIFKSSSANRQLLACRQKDAYYNTSEDGEGDFSGDYMCSEVAESSVPLFRKLLVSGVFLLIFLLGSLGNLLVIVILWRYRQFRTSTELFLFHLALANLLLVLTFPFGVVESIAGWVFGTFLCKVLSATHRINFYSSSLLLGCISVDRYLAVVYAVQTFRKRRALSIHLTCLVVWLLSLLLTLPDLLFTQVWTAASNMSICHFAPSGVHGFNSWVAMRFLYHIVGFFLPLVLMGYCYSAIVRALCQSQRLQRQKAVKVAIVVTGVFLLCWSPYHVVIFLQTLTKLEARNVLCAAEDWLSTPIMVSELIGFSHCFLNPILYAFVGTRFRHDACRVLHDLGCLSQSALQDILDAGRMESRRESSLETNISTIRQPASPCAAMNLLAISSDPPAPSASAPAAPRPEAQLGTAGLDSGRGRGGLSKGPHSADWSSTSAARPPASRGLLPVGE